MRYPALRKVGALLMLVAMTISVALTAGCAIQLAPLYDKALVDGLTSADAQALQLMASAAGGTTQSTFASREPHYSEVIGRFDALALQAAARPVPSNDVTAAMKKIIDSRLNKGRGTPVIASAGALEEISKTLSTMRDTDRKQGLTAFEVQNFKSVLTISMDQALTYEAALQR